MKNGFHKMMSVSMAFLLLASTVSWKVEKHYCLGHLMDLSFFTPAQDCGMALDVKADHTLNIQEQDSCCANEIIFVEGQTNLKPSFNDFSLDQQLFLVALTASYFRLFQFEKELPIPDKNYPPPLIVKDLQLLDKVFLI